VCPVALLGLRAALFAFGMCKVRSKASPNNQVELKRLQEWRSQNRGKNVAGSKGHGRGEGGDCSMRNAQRAISKDKEQLRRKINNRESLVNNDPLFGLFPAKLSSLVTLARVTGRRTSVAGGTAAGSQHNHQ
jgi:hypothetical protein